MERISEYNTWQDIPSRELSLIIAKEEFRELSYLC